MNKELSLMLQELASKYETKDFLKEDPSRFMHNYSDSVEQELAAFIAANLSFGSRKQFCKKIQSILDNAKNSIKEWILEQSYKDFFKTSDESFYRMFSHNDMLCFFNRLYSILKEYGSLQNAVKNQSKDEKFLHNAVSALFCNVKIVPQGKSSAKKKLCMFCRWMVRNNSPVDLGLWDFFPKENLIIPLDVHVLEESQNLGLTKRKSSDFKTACEITEELKLIWPDDPLKGDFALFGRGIEPLSK